MSEKMKESDFIKTYTGKLKAILDDAVKNKNSQLVEYHEVQLFLVNKKVYGEILVLKNEANSIELKFKRKEKDNFFNIAKVLNETISYKYNLSMKDTYITVSDPEKIKERINTLFKINANTQLRIMDETIKEKNLYDSNKEDFIREVHVNINNERKKLDFVLNNFDDLNSSISTYKIKVPREHIYFNMENGKNIQTLLRRNVVNVLYYMENEKTYSNEKSSKFMNEFIENGQNIFGNFYIQKKDDDTWKEFIELTNKLDNK